MTAITTLRHPLAALHLAQRRGNTVIPQASAAASDSSTSPVSPVSPGARTTGRFAPADCHLADLRELVEQSTDPTRVPHAARIQRNVPIYPAGVARGLTPEARHALQ